MVWFQLLGHVSARSEGGEIPLGSARQRAVLAALLIEPGAHVSLDQLVDRVWGTTPPRSARQTLHSYVSRLRSVLDDHGGPLLERRSGGYVLEADESAVDLQRFRALVAQARRADDDHAGALWQEAMGLWQGRPFADLDSDWLRSTAVRLEAERLAAVLDRNDLLLRSGEHARLLPDVTAAAEKHPLDERLAGQLMLALYRCGRQADALAHYRLLQERLADELGSDPGPELRELYQRILRHDPELATPPTASVLAPADPSGTHADSAAGGTSVDVVPTPARPSHRPAQLPLDVAGFTGRRDDLRRLDELLPDVGDDHASRTVVITAIGGTAGVGKTALAVHWAHRVADRFPDGQLYVNLRGYDPEQPMRPTDALARFLVALGVPERDIPLDDDERAARYRSELADRRMLIVLDNVGSVAQVRPLLPGSGSSLVVVTSRDSLAGLVAVHGAHRFSLDLLPANEATELLHRLIGDRVVAEPAAASTLAEQCARLPLALRVAAVLATSQPDRSLADVTAELADRQERLELLDPGGDRYAAVHAVFSWSVQHLPEQAARTFRRLGLHPGPDLDQYVAAALTGLAPKTARRVLETLVAAHLLHRPSPGRFGMHDLLRAYATHLAYTEDDENERDAAEERLLTYYQNAAIATMGTLRPAESSYQPESPGPEVSIPDLTTQEAARGWVESERYCILAVAEHTAETARFSYTVALARILHRYLTDAYLTDVLVINDHALRAAKRADDPVGQAHALRQLGVGYTRLSQYGAAATYGERALALFRSAGDLEGEAVTLTNLGSVHYQRGDHRASLENYMRSLAVSRRAGNRRGEAVALTNAAIIHDRQGDLAASIENNLEALAINRELGLRYTQAVTLNNLAGVEMQVGRYGDAVDHAREALAIVEDLGSQRGRAHILDTLGSLHLLVKEPDQAAQYFRLALAAFRETGERSGQAWSINGMGEAAQLTGDLDGALTLHAEALSIANGDGNRHQQARSHAFIGHVHRRLGDRDLALKHYEYACTIYTELKMPEAEEMRAEREAVSAPANG